MSEFMDQLPQAVQDHIRKIAPTAGLAETEESYERFAEGWIEKRTAFESRVAEMGMEERDEFVVDEDHGALLLTYSGSLLTIGPLSDGGRTMDYASVGLRMDVPEHVEAEGVSLAQDVGIGRIARFTSGPVQSSSAIYAIAVATADLDLEEEAGLLTEINKALIEDFVEINKTIIQG